MKRIILLLTTVMLTASATIGQNRSASAKDNDNLFYRNSFQLNIAGLGFERYGIAYELRLSLLVSLGRNNN